jgi:hypothetical protein
MIYRDWNSILARARRRGAFSHRDKVYASSLSCLYDFGLDSAAIATTRAFVLGQELYSAVELDDVPRAERAVRSVRAFATEVFA